MVALLCLVLVATPLFPAPEDDEAAQRLSEAGTLAQGATPEARRQAAAKYEEAVRLLRARGDSRRLAQALEDLTDLHSALGAVKDALPTIREALALREAAGDAAEAAHDLNHLGTLLNAVGDNRQAKEALERAAAAHGRLGDRLGEAEALNNLAYVHFRLGENERARDLYARALEPREAAGEKALAAQTLHYMAMVDMATGQYRRALEEQARGLELFRAVGDRYWEGATLHNMARARLELGETREALETLAQAQGAAEAIGDRRGAAHVLLTTAMARAVLGEHRAALENTDRALAIFREIGVALGEAQALSRQAGILSSLGDWDLALSRFEQALLLLRGQGDRAGEAMALQGASKALNTLGRREEARASLASALELARAAADADGEGRILTSLGELQRASGAADAARSSLERALSLHHGTGNRAGEAMALEGLGRLAAEGREPETALAHWSRALDQYRSIGDRSGEAQVLHDLAGVEAARGRLGEARERSEAALAIVESLRGAVAGTELRIAYAASTQEIYERYVDVLMQLGARSPGGDQAAAAFAVSERARARALLDALSAAGVDPRQGVAAELRERESHLRARLNARERHRMRLMREGRPLEERRAVETEIAEIVGALQDTERRTWESTRGHAALGHPVPSTLDEIQRSVLDDETVLLEYALGSERSFLWLVTRSGLHSVTLPARADIEAAARRVHRLINARQERVAFETPAGRRRRVAAADAAYPAAASALSRMILGPVAPRLARKRLLVVPHGALHFVPFAALPKPGGGGGARPLVADHEIVTSPSASVLAALRRQTSGRAPAPKELAILADPVFEHDDPRIRPERAAAPAAPGPSAELVRRAGEAFGLERIPRLPHSREEAEAILGLAPEDRRLKALDFAASRETALSPEMRRYRILHFATHGFMDADHPELSGLVLSLVDEQGRPQDGFLRLHDVYNLDLSADLVVLNACQTAVGKETPGEGLIGLTRGFLHAGAAGVIASLWSSSDEASAVLITRFYRGLLEEKLTASAALRQAQLSMWRERRWRAPRFWAGLILQGEWRK